jgi:hypothetical protein
MNPARPDGNKKIDRILVHEIKYWKTRTRKQLLDELVEEKRFFLETELEFGNEEYLDELLEEWES